MPRVLANLLGRSLRWARGQPLLPALAVAAVVTAVLAAVVLAPLFVPALEEPPVSVAGAVVNAERQPPDSADAVVTATPPPAPTATPWPRRPRAPSPTPESAAAATATTRPKPVATATPPPLPTPTPSPVPSPTATATPAVPTPEPLYLAQADGLASWGGLDWRFDGNLLINDGASVTAQPWIVGPQPAIVDGGYAVEVEVQVRGVTAGYCEQSFGVVTVGPDGFTPLGGGMLYLCDGSKPVARITDLGAWADGYNRDAALASTRLDPGPGWHTVRLEIAAGELRLLIDGEVATTATLAAPAAGAREVTVGLWSQGVQLDVRRVAVVPLSEGA